MTKKILVVDDDPDIVAVLEARLQANGYEVITAGNGSEALIKIRDGKPDLLLLDIMMPVLDGVELAQVLKNCGHARGIPIIFVTALRKKKEQEQAGACVEGQLIFSKPFDSEKLLATIRETVEARDSQIAFEKTG